MKNLKILANLIEHKAETSGELDVLTFVDIKANGQFQEEIRTYQDLQDNGMRVANRLISHGMNKGDSFAMVMQNHPEFVDCMVGSSIAGTVFVPIDPRTKGDRLSYMLSFADCRGVVCADYCLEAVFDVSKTMKNIEWIWVLPTGEGKPLPANDTNIVSFGDILEDQVKQIDVRASSHEDIMQMLYTSGTTGDPKAIRAPYTRFDAVSSLGSAIGLQESDRPYTGLSLTHANAQLVCMGNVLKMGLRGVISRRFTKSRLWDICRHYQCTTFNLLGGMTTAIYSEQEKSNDADNPVRFILSAGMPAVIWNDFKRRFNVELFEFYGAAEGGMLMNPPGAGPVGSIGKPPPNLEAKIIDEEGNTCGPNEMGEIVFRSLVKDAPIKVEYYKNPEATAKKVVDGVMYTGDIGHQDEDGWFYFDSRKGDEVRRNGEFLDLTLIEKTLAEFPDVADVFVYGIPAVSGVPGEKDVVAAIVPLEAKLFDPNVLVSHCKQSLSTSLLPSFVQVMSEIPKTASEKPQARFCQKLLEEQKNHVYKFG